MGAVTPQALVVVSSLALVASALVLAAGAARGSLELPPVPLWPLASFLALALLQLRAAAGGPAPAARTWLVRVWHPANVAVASVLGGAARPLSLDPGTTLHALALTGGLGLLAVLAAPALVAAADGDSRAGRRRRRGVPALRLRDLGAGPLRVAALRDDSPCPRPLPSARS